MVQPYMAEEQAALLAHLWMDMLAAAVLAQMPMDKTPLPMFRLVLVVLAFKTILMATTITGLVVAVALVIQTVLVAMAVLAEEVLAPVEVLLAVEALEVVLQ
jgi:hypothetical protein